MPDIVIRFVTDDSITSGLIRLQAGLAMPFTPSHVEALSRDGQHYTGAHLDGGVLPRIIGYDAGQSGRKEFFARVPSSQDQYDAFHEYLESKIGEPYDWKAIFSFVDPDDNLHELMHTICSALITMCLRAPKAPKFPFPLTVPAHHVSPRDLALILSSHIEIDH